MCDAGHRFPVNTCYDISVETSTMPKPFQVKFIAAFLLLFVCMNAGGAVCVAYCRGVVLNAKSDHCPLAKQQRHCDKPAPIESDGKTALAAIKLDCCPMLVSFIPGTLEAKQQFDLTSVVTAVVKPGSTALPHVPRHRFETIPAYRGPPKDERVLHITNRIIRI